MSKRTRIHPVQFLFEWWRTIHFRRKISSFQDEKQICLSTENDLIWICIWSRLLSYPKNEYPAGQYQQQFESDHPSYKQYQYSLPKGPGRYKGVNGKNMAVTKIHGIKTTVDKAIEYICNPDKTDQNLYISSFACSPETAVLDFKYTLDHTHDCRDPAQYK